MPYKISNQPERNTTDNHLLCPPYAQWSAHGLLRYFQTRQHVHYFALRDEEQASQSKVNAILENRFEYNDEAYYLVPGFDWTANPSADVEWLILLHKFYFAVGLGEDYVNTGDPRLAQKWVELTEAWIDNVPLDFLSSDVTGRRVQNWIFAHHYFVNSDYVLNLPAGAKQPTTPGLTPVFHQKFLRSLHQQVDFLCHNLTPARNHRTIELYAIFMAAVVFPEFADAADWLDFAKAELVQNIQADLRADGVHCEQSIDYHHLVVKNYLGVKRLATANGIEVPRVFDDRLQAALNFAMYAHKPDGDIPSLSDGDARSFLDLLHQGYALYGNPEWLYTATQGRECQAPRVRSTTFMHGGYTVMRSGWGTGETPYADERYLIFDSGPLGEGNHGHLDLLNFEMAAYGQSLIVDPGRYTYHEPHPDSGEMNWRVRFRGTAYHNTVQVDGKEQTRYVFHKHKFKIRGPEPKWELRDFLSNADFDFVHGVAASYEYDAIHERTILFAGLDYWIVTDALFGESEHRYDLRFHLSDAANGHTTLTSERGMTLLQAPHLLIAQPEHPSKEVALEEGFVSRTYGVRHPAPVLRSTRHAQNALFQTVLYPYAQTPPTIQLEQIPVWRGEHLCAPHEAIGLRVMVRSEEKSFVDTFLHARWPDNGPYTIQHRSLGELRSSTSPLLIRQCGAQANTTTNTRCGVQPVVLCGRRGAVVTLLGHTFMLE